MTRCEPCQCGGVIYADSIEFASVAVDLHNKTDRHVIWRFQREGRFSAEEPTATASGDLSRLSGSASAPLLRVGWQERRTH